MIKVNNHITAFFISYKQRLFLGKVGYDHPAKFFAGEKQVEPFWQNPTVENEQKHLLEIAKS